LKEICKGWALLLVVVPNEKREKRESEIGEKVNGNEREKEAWYMVYKREKYWVVGD